MARLGRRFPFQPQLGGPVVVFLPTLPRDDQRKIRVLLVTQPRLARVRREPHSKLRPPVVLAGAQAAPLARPVQVVLAERQPARAVRSRLAPPAARELVEGQKQLRVSLVRVPARRPLATVLQPPAVVTAASQPPVETTLRAQIPQPIRPQKANSRVRPPEVVDAPAAPQDPVETTIRVLRAWRARYDRRDWMQPVLPGPTTVDPAQGQPPVVTDLQLVFPVRAQRQRYKTTYELLPPQVVGAAVGSPPVVVGIYTTLAAIRTRAEYRRRIAPFSLLNPPATLVAPQPPVVTKLKMAVPLRVPRQRQDAFPVLRAPVVVDIPAAPTLLTRTLTGVGR